jgi:transcriptional regulator with XRE-family HTH domain
MSSFTKWDRDAYIERVGGQEEAERRRKELMARQSGHRLAEERKRHGLTQAQLAQAMGVTPGRVSQIERGELATIEAAARYVEALGGRLDLVASFGDHTLTLAGHGGIGCRAHQHQVIDDREVHHAHCRQRIHGEDQPTDRHAGQQPQALAAVQPRQAIRFSAHDRRSLHRP